MKVVELIFLRIFSNHQSLTENSIQLKKKTEPKDVENPTIRETRPRVSRLCSVQGMSQVTPLFSNLENRVFS